jgi:hypothetical protein
MECSLNFINSDFLRFKRGGGRMKNKIEFVLTNITEHQWYDCEYEVHYYDFTLPCGEIGSMYDPVHNGMCEVISINPCQTCSVQGCQGFTDKEIIEAYYEYLRERKNV